MVYRQYIGSSQILLLDSGNVRMSLRGNQMDRSLKIGRYHMHKGLQVCFKDLIHIATMMYQAAGAKIEGTLG
jgi:hypothetical protein